MIKRLLLALLVALLGASSALAHPADTDPDPDRLGLGGSSRLTPDTVLPFSPGAPTRYESSTFLQNTGGRDLTINLSTNVPPGTLVEPLIEMPFVLAAGEGIRVPFAITSGVGLVEGLYDAIVSFGGSIEGPLMPGTTFLPGFSILFRIRAVSGEPGFVTVRAVNSDDGRPAVGRLSLYYLDLSGSSSLLDSVEGSQLERTIPPGKYRANFSIEGLTSQDQEFEIAAGEEKEVIIQIQGINFLVVNAKPRGLDGSVDAALLTMAVYNNLRRVPGPVRFVADIKRNGELVEKFQLTEFAELPEGITEQQSTYVPPGGFRPGKWTFEFSLVAPEYTIKAFEVPGFEVPRRIAGLPVWAALLLGLALLGGAGWFFFILWRRRRDEEEEEEFGDR